LRRLADWLVECGIETVAMEATGVYWIPIYEILEDRGLEVILVNARHVVPARFVLTGSCRLVPRKREVLMSVGSRRTRAERGMGQQDEVQVEVASGT
jgi:transposase